MLTSKLCLAVGACVLHLLFLSVVATRSVPMTAGLVQSVRQRALGGYLRQPRCTPQHPAALKPTAVGSQTRADWAAHRISAAFAAARVGGSDARPGNRCPEAWRAVGPRRLTADHLADLGYRHAAPQTCHRASRSHNPAARPGRRRTQSGHSRARPDPCLPHMAHGVRARTGRSSARQGAAAPRASPLKAH